MRTSRLKIACKILAVLVVAALANAAITYALEPYGSKSRVMWEDYAATVEQGVDVDTVFVGTSFVSCGIDPAVFDTEAGTVSFNMGSLSQTLDESLIAIETACEDFEVRRIVLGLSSDELRRSEPTNPASPFLRERARAVGWPNAMAAIASQLFQPATLASTKSLNCLFPWVENHVEPNASSIMENLRMRLSNMPVREAASIQDDNWDYVGRGYGTYDLFYDPDENPEFYFTNEFIEAGDSALDADRERTLREICAFCQDNDIELIVITLPMTANNIEYYGDDYFTLHDQIAGLLGEFDVSYYDFNLAKPNLFDPKLEYFANNTHLNVEGSAVFSAALGAFLADPTEPDDPALFYTEQEYWDSLEGVSAVIMYPETVDTGVHVDIEATSAPKDADRIEFRMLLRGDDGTWQCVRDWSQETSYLYERSETGVFDIRVEARVIGSDYAQHDDDFERYHELTLYYRAP